MRSSTVAARRHQLRPDHPRNHRDRNVRHRQPSRPHSDDHFLPSLSTTTTSHYSLELHLSHQPFASSLRRRIPSSSGIIAEPVDPSLSCVASSVPLPRCKTSSQVLRQTTVQTTCAPFTATTVWVCGMETMPREGTSTLPHKRPLGYEEGTRRSNHPWVSFAI